MNNKPIVRAWDLRTCRNPQLASETFRGLPANQIVTFFVRDDNRWLVYLTNKMSIPGGTPSCTLNVRDRTTAGEPERTIAVPSEIYSAMKGVSQGEIVKVRRTIIGPEKWGRLFISVSFDQYQERHSQFIVLEAEFTSDEEANLFALPPWAEGAIEITGDPAYQPHRMAKSGTTPPSR
jgi:hypothetical protein